MDKVRSPGQVEMSTQEDTLKMSVMGMVRWFGQMGQHIKENG